MRDDDTPGEWARICRIQAALTTDLPTRAILLDLSAQYEAIARARSLEAAETSARSRG